MFGKRHDEHGLSDRALLFENVENLLTYMPKERLDLLKGFHIQIYVVSAACFACATHRVRLIGVCFRSEDDMARFEPPAALTDRPSALKDCIDDVYSKRSVWGTFLFAKQAKLRTHTSKLPGKTIVGRDCELGIDCITSTYDFFPAVCSAGQGTFLCIAQEFASVKGKLSKQQEATLLSDAAEQVRKFHPREIMRAFSWSREETEKVASLFQGKQKDYEVPANTISPNMFEAFAASMLLALGKTEPHARYKAKIEALREKGELPSASEVRSEYKRMKHQTTGVEYWVMKPPGPAAAAAQE